MQALPEGILSVRHLLSIRSLQRQDVGILLDTAFIFDEVNHRDLKKVPFLRGKTVANLFFENSTRTKISFDIAAKRLSADTIHLAGSSSSTQKGETLLDTGRNIQAMKPDMVVIRHAQSGSAQLLSTVVKGSVINAGDGWHEHPTQALLDAFTLLKHFKRTPQEGLIGKKIVIVGDIKHSRVARSNLILLKLLGACVSICGPMSMLPMDIYDESISVIPNLDEALKNADVVMLLRIQKERLQSVLFPSDEEYFQLYGLTLKRASQLKPEAVILHPGPINRGVEIASEVADSTSSLILEQAENGVAVRMAVLYCLSRVPCSL